MLLTAARKKKIMIAMPLSYGLAGWTGVGCDSQSRYKESRSSTEKLRTTLKKDADTPMAYTLTNEMSLASLHTLKIYNVKFLSIIFHQIVHLFVQLNEHKMDIRHLLAYTNT